MLFRYRCIATPEQCVGRPEAIDRDDDAAREAQEQGVVVNVGCHGQRAGLAALGNMQFCAMA